jgi:uncharacterized protein involved in exopolysaccharide biosynthesis
MASEPIDLKDLILFFLNKKWLFLKCCLGFLILGILIIFLTRNHYNANLKFIAQTGSSSGAGGLMKQLGGLSGLGMGSFGDNTEVGISPQLYQEVLLSYPFLWELCQKEISIQGEKMLLGDYIEMNRRPSVPALIKKYTIGLPSLFSAKEITPPDFKTQIPDSLIFTRGEVIPVLNSFRDIFTIENDVKTGAILLTVQTLNPEVSAQLAVMSYKLLSEYVIMYKIERAQHTLDFVEKSFLEAKERFYESQEKLSSFRDRNQNLSFSSAMAMEERLLAEFNLANNLYNNLAIQRDQARIKVQEEIPQLSIINPPVVSNQPSKPNITLIVAISLFLGATIGFTIILFSYLKFYLNK